MAQQTTRKAGHRGLLPRVLVLGLVLGLLLFPVAGLRSSLVFDAGDGTTVYASSVAGIESEVAIAGVTTETACPLDMIAYWKLDEVDGNSGYEDSWNDHDGVCGRTCPRSNPGQVGRSQKFNGDDREINVAAHSDFDWGLADSFSVEFWMRRPDTAMVGNEVIVGRDYSSQTGARHWWVGLRDNGRAAFYINDADGGPVASVLGSVALTDTVWHHMAAVYDGTAARIRLYVDGQFEQGVDTFFDAGFNSPKDLNIGWIDYGAQGFHFNGYVDEVALYGRALGAQEIDEHYDAGWQQDLGYCSNPSISVDKLASPGEIYPDEWVNYTYLVRNPGDTEFVTVAIRDDTCAGVSAPTGDDGNGMLDPGGTETWTYTCSMTVNQDTTNTVTVTGTYDYPLQSTIVATEMATVNVLTPAVDVVKVPDADAVYLDPGTGTVDVTYAYTTTNTSNDDLSNASVSDDRCSPVAQQTGDSTLAGGEAQTYSCTATLSQDTTNVATFAGVDALGRTWTFTGTATVDVIAPDVQVVKTANPGVIYGGETVTYTYTVTNNGDDELSNIDLADDRCSPVTLKGSDDGTLQTGETVEYTCSTTLVGDTTNTGTFSGVDILGRTWTFTDTASVRVLGPQIALDKVASATAIYPGETVRYDYSVTNPGNDPLSTVRVTDDKCTPVTFIRGDSNGNNKLDPGETWSYWCPSRPLTVNTTNVATASARDSQNKSIVSPEASVTVYVIHPAIGLDKSAEESSIDVGDTAVYRYEVTNTGDDPLSNVEVTDDKCAPPGGSPGDPVTYVSGDTNANGKLDVGEVWLYTCSMVLSENTTNIAEATGDDSAGGPVIAQDTETVNVGSFVYLPIIKRP